ncbi:hypothetical protein NIES4075_10410 [Tolypothrix sp. NIES-4075]|uniref:hypothetical protein n=1 Tax=Tolypothrix sp. NIES-4075 TaxID=2005459 RepID=UPI000B5CA2F5|nr:hypothetical protein [Tolypothrix sp. NIES-4075]GAX40079.1 hypothetical protein NIES4075_10410 [Tolypothrix sp. NIES-4075]
MNIRKELECIIEQLNDEQLSILLDLAVSLQSGKKPVYPIESQAYQDWLSAENDIYDKIFADELTAR